MRREDCFFLGKIVRKYSFKGEVLIKIEADDPRQFTEMESVFVDMDDKLIPFFLEQASIHKPGLLRVKFEEVDNEQTAGNLIGKELWLPLSTLPEPEEGGFYFHEITGFAVQDVHFGKIGTVKGVDDRSPQPLLQIEQGEKEILIPLADELIKEVDKDNKLIVLETPEGLIELYLE